MTKLKPCPFCGNENPVYWCYTEGYFTDRWAVLCYYPDGGCGAEGSHRKSREEAAAAWNERSYEKHKRSQKVRDVEETNFDRMEKARNGGKNTYPAEAENKRTV